MNRALLKAKRTDNGDWIYQNIFGEICDEEGTTLVSGRDEDDSRFLHKLVNEV